MSFVVGSKGDLLWVYHCVRKHHKLVEWTRVCPVLLTFCVSDYKLKTILLFFFNGKIALLHLKDWRSRTPAPTESAALWVWDPFLQSFQGQFPQSSFCIYSKAHFKLIWGFNSLSRQIKRISSKVTIYLVFVLPRAVFLLSCSEGTVTIKMNFGLKRL